MKKRNPKKSSGFKEYIKLVPITNSISDYANQPYTSKIYTNFFIEVIIYSIAYFVVSLVLPQYMSSDIHSIFFRSTALAITHITVEYFVLIRFEMIKHKRKHIIGFLLFVLSYALIQILVKPLSDHDHNVLIFLSLFLVSYPIQIVLKFLIYRALEKQTSRILYDFIIETSMVKEFYEQHSEKLTDEEIIKLAEEDENIDFLLFIIENNLINKVDYKSIKEKFIKEKDEK